VFDRYLKDSGVEMTFEEFCEEFYERRDIMLGLGMLVCHQGLTLGSTVLAVETKGFPSNKLCVHNGP